LSEHNLTYSLSDAFALLAPKDDNGDVISPEDINQTSEPVIAGVLQDNSTEILSYLAQELTVSDKHQEAEVQDVPVTDDAGLAEASIASEGANTEKPEVELEESTVAGSEDEVSLDDKIVDVLEVASVDTGPAEVSESDQTDSFELELNAGEEEIDEIIDSSETLTESDETNQETPIYKSSESQEMGDDHGGLQLSIDDLVPPISGGNEGTI